MIGKKIIHRVHTVHTLENIPWLPARPALPFSRNEIDLISGGDQL